MCSGKLNSDVLTSVQYLVSLWRSTFVTVFPYAEFPNSLIVAAMIALLGSVSPARRAAETDSPKCWKHGFRLYSITDPPRGRAQGTTEAGL